MQGYLDKIKKIEEKLSYASPKECKKLVPQLINLKIKFGSRL